ncbi:MAG: hypothetical protein WBW71_00745 [Bacteroidota bacterium]
MFDFNDPNTIWLNVTNIVLGLVTLICCVAVGRGVFQDVRARIRKRVPVKVDDHVFVIPELGITMADGGERLDKNVGKRKNNSEPSSDEKNIFRSEN